jgi:hypothetical protein
MMKIVIDANGELREYWFPSKTKVGYWKKNFSQSHYVHHKSFTDYHGIRPQPLRWEAEGV